MLFQLCAGVEIKGQAQTGDNLAWYAASKIISCVLGLALGGRVQTHRGGGGDNLASCCLLRLSAVTILVNRVKLGPRYELERFCLFIIFIPCNVVMLMSIIVKH